ncbi:signal peptidase I SipW [Virgibacillus litoralis]|uniref:Signal peptidase I n=1 Tax=Virgibacillus litoralis TaxID=578221 RepID=A0ABS4HCG6_9BACI|nr:signal peptidase I [Virgibacillus litoralis]MBP1948182.1 signal peptidase [Virgibacillus litoralis]
MRKKNTIKRISNLISTLLILTLIAMTLIVISSRISGDEPQLFGYQFKTVLSGSMDPEFSTGSIILVKRVNNTNAIIKGDIITFKQADKNLVTHRVVEAVKKDGVTLYRTKGDNNENADMSLVSPEKVVSKYTGFTVPYAGYLVNHAGSPIGVAILLIVPGLLLLGYAFLTFRATIKEIESRTKSLNLQLEDLQK